ncbi:MULTISPECIES: SAM-dependent methyltransferase [Mycobacterium]|uniref:SAM-dependent methyltransferase n=1 Tax=Mycobacterium TaxID=1763 RepID=UPI00200DC945|nr:MULTISPECIES: class I SAM-dependent methyltransferase [Mycobacterium]UQB93130.1 class I SAM-dependent methyltransferase [Mycobacterium intracellulare]WSE46153.1 class I SAM-dependent methyltransferase [Mycobacterium sp. 3-98]
MGLRTDDDTWDLASSVGATATMVAAGRARASRAQSPVIDDPFAEPLVRAVGIDFLTRWATGELESADIDLPGLPWGFGPMTDMLAARTRYFDIFCRDAIAAGIRQTVILASGLDARAYRLSWPDGMALFEIDQPDVLQFKTATLAKLGAVTRANLRTVGIDLRQDWPAALRNAGFDSSRATAWIVEGLLAFIPPEGQDKLLADITTLSSKGSRLAAEIFLNSDDGSAATTALKALGARWRERGFEFEFSGLHYPGPRNDVATYLGQRGWVSERTSPAELLADSGFAGPVGDDAFLAQDYYCTSVLPV